MQHEKVPFGCSQRCLEEAGGLEILVMESVFLTLFVALERMREVGGVLLREGCECECVSWRAAEQAHAYYLPQ